MGVTGLLNNLKPIIKCINLSELNGKTAAIDCFSWLHKGIYFNGKDTYEQNYTPIINFCMDQIEVLENNGIKPILVFDGCGYPYKADLNLKRSEAKKAAKIKLELDIKEGKIITPSDYSKSIPVNFDITSSFIKELRKKKKNYIVAPFEADAQIAYLSHNNIIDFVISEDQDLIPFGCKNILFKWKVGSLSGDYLKLNDIFLKQNENENDNLKLNFNNFNLDMFQNMCILSGCDYIKNIKSIGLIKSYKLIEKYKNLEIIFQNLIKTKKEIPKNYIKQFYYAKYSFKYQPVFNNIIDYTEQNENNIKLVPLTEPNLNNNDELYSQFQQNVKLDCDLISLANGSLNPKQVLTTKIESLL